MGSQKGPGVTMRILVTGNLGFVGSVVAPYLAARGHEVQGLDAGYFESCLFGRPADPPTVRKDVRDLEPEDLEGFQAVVHLAALSNDPLGELDPDLTAAINLGGTLRVAEAARRAGVARMVFASSCSLYGLGGAAAVDESGDMRPQTAYAKSKIDAEAALDALGRDDFSPVFLRFATAYGVSPRLRLDLVVNNLVGWAVSEGVIRIQSDGSPWRPLVHVEDMARAIAAALEAPREVVHRQAFNVGRSDANYQVKTIAADIGRLLPHCQVSINPQASPDTRSYRVSFDRIHAALPDFRPEWGLERGILQLRDAYREHGLDQATFHDRRFTRLLQLKHLLENGQLGSNLRWTQ